MMVLEWIRRRDPKFDEMMRKYLFKQGSIVGVEEAATGKAGAGAAWDGNARGAVSAATEAAAPSRAARAMSCRRRKSLTCGGAAVRRIINFKISGLSLDSMATPHYSH